MALDFAALQTEFYARGFSDLDDDGSGATRAKRWLNDAMHEIDAMQDWPYRLASTTGTAPLTISDLGTIESVTVVSLAAQLTPALRGQLRGWFADLTTTGDPEYFYLTSGSTIAVYPANASVTLTVDYWKVGDDLSADGDTPLMPDRYRMAIVDHAAARAHRDRGDITGATAARAAGDALVAQMVVELLAYQHQGSNLFVELVGDDS